MIRFDPTDADAFVSIIGAKNRENSVNMDLLDNKRSDGMFFEACRFVNKLSDFITWLVVVELVAKAFAVVVVFINDSLMTFSDKIVVCNSGNRQEHVALKYKGMR
jgi:hypothetical protein